MKTPQVANTPLSLPAGSWADSLVSHGRRHGAELARLSLKRAGFCGVCAAKKSNCCDIRVLRRAKLRG